VLLLTIGTWALWAGYGLLGLCTAFVLARLLAFAFAHLLARAQVGPIGVRVDSQYWWKLVRVAAPFGVFTAVLNLYSYVDTLMLGELRTDQETGLYSAAHRIYEGVVNLASITATVAGPQLARDFVHNRTRHSRLARLVVVASLAAAIPIAIVVALVASRAMTTLFGAEYASAAGVLQILVAGLVFVFPLQIMQAVAVSVNEERRLVRAAIIGCVANVAFNAALIPAFGMFGSATATVISEGISLTVIVIGVRHIVWSSSSHPIEVPAERGP
jgi:O-antigen/teichoic acid export membrane protein